MPARRADVASHVFGPSVQSAVLVAVTIVVFIAIAACVGAAVIEPKIFGHPCLLADSDGCVCFAVAFISNRVHFDFQGADGDAVSRIGNA